MPRTLLLLPGDGIGPEVTAQARRVAHRLWPELVIEERLFGGAAYDVEGGPLSPATLALAKACDAVLMGAVGGPKWSGAPRALRPEAGLLALRSGMGVYANLRPALCFAPWPGPRPPEGGGGSRARHHMIVRELTGGVYFTAGHGRAASRPWPMASDAASTLRSTPPTRSSTGLAGGLRPAPGRPTRQGVTSCEKSNVMETGLLWREVVGELHAREFADVALEHMLADNAAMQLVKNPRQFDVILTDNLFGDMLSDEAAQLTGSLGMLPSAAIGEAGKPGLYEPIHGSAPDIAGQGLANPLAAILSLQMALRWSLGRVDLADRVGAAVERALEGGARTRDLGGSLTTAEMGEAVLAAL